MAWVKRSGIMLCQPLDEKNLARNFKMTSHLLSQPKLDGMRAWVDYVEGEPVLISSTGHVIQGMPHILLSLKGLNTRSGRPLNYDGELYVHGMEFEEIISRTRRSVELHEDYSAIQYHIFDYKSQDVQAERTAHLQGLFADWQASTELTYALQLVPTKLCTKEQVAEQLDAYVAQGYEGIILRNPYASYTETRPFTCLKWKPSKSDAYKIVGVEEAISEEGIPLGRVGALTCVDRFGNEFRVGPGLGITHKEAEDMWAKKDALPGSFAQVYYQNLTTNGVPRFGKFSLIVTPTNEGDWR